MLDEISQAVLAREEVVKYLRGGYGENEEPGARADLRLPRRAADDAAVRILPRAAAPALPDPAQDRAHPRAPAPRRSRPRATTASCTRRITRATSTISSSRSCSTTTACGRRSSPPASTCSAARSGLIHRHVTGAIPIRRNTKDPGVPDHAQGLRRRDPKKHDLFFYPEGGRSYSGELKPSKTGPVQRRARRADVPDLVIMPVAIAYDLVLEDHILAQQRVKKRQRPFARELAEMVRYAVGYRSRAFVTFGAPIAGRRSRRRSRAATCSS